MFHPYSFETIASKNHTALEIKENFPTTSEHEPAAVCPWLRVQISTIIPCQPSASERAFLALILASMRIA
jgi:hypothetical protein